MSILFSKNSYAQPVCQARKMRVPCSENLLFWDLSSLPKAFLWISLTYLPFPIGQFLILSQMFKFFQNQPISIVALLMATFVWSCQLLPSYGQGVSPFKYSPAIQEAFNYLKVLFTSTPSLHHFDPGLQITLHCKGSNPNCHMQTYVSVREIGMLFFLVQTRLYTYAMTP